jgi:hypothetical protein
MNAKRLWKGYVKVFPYELDTEAGAPYYAQWAVWCWRKPIWYGLPLMVAVPVFAALDLVLGAVWVFATWGRSGAGK